MNYAEVAVNSPLAGRRTFSYHIPPGMVVVVGQAVWVPFGPRRLHGIIVELTPFPQVAETRGLDSIIDPPLALPPTQLALGRWLSQRYFSSLFDALALMLPPGFERQAARPKMVPYLHPAVSREVAEEALVRLAKRSPGQVQLLRLLMDTPEPMPLPEARQRTGCSPAIVKSLEQKGLIQRQMVRVRRDPLANLHISPLPPPTTTPAQESALAAIRAALRQGESAVFLLHGITGSGKTEVYLQALAEAVSLGKQGIVLVPEISLTPQTVARFASRFPGKVAVFHSGLSPGEQFDEWQRIKAGECQVVIGARSALFAPVPNLGLIVLDEEHETTYKQEAPPRYHAREVAIERARLERAAVVLGSATPDVESYYRARKGEYRLLELPRRPIGDLPQVEIVDMRRELREGNRSIFSRALSRALAEVLEAGQQAILFLNRRGTATSVQCRRCGTTLCCPRCEVALTYHGPEGNLLCHHCNYKRALPRACPGCGQPGLKFLGLGTQRLEAELSQLLPTARALRWDWDVTRGKHAHERILASFLAGEANVLIGTQMVAKGLDMPSVTLVGVVLADSGLYLPHFRAGERTFQLLSQVAGRAGRGRLAGRVIAQTFSPEHYAIVCGAAQDYVKFYDTETAYRRRYGHPPFTRLVRLVYAHTSLARSHQGARRLASRLLEWRESQGLGDIEVIGPTPAPIPRLRGRYRWQLFLRGADPLRLLEGLAVPQGWVVDVDPLDLL